MPTPANLYEYYTSKGQSLPSVSDRGQLYQQYGLGSANQYTGTADQNTALLGKLGTPAPNMSTPTGPQYAPPPAVATSTPLASQFNANQNYFNTNYNSTTPTSTPNSTSVASYKDNPNGTTTNYLANRQSDTGTYSKNADGTLTFQPLSSPPSTNPQLQDIIKKANEILSSPNALAAMTPEMKAQLEKINGMNAQNSGLAAKAQQEQSTGNITGFNALVEQLKQNQSQATNDIAAFAQLIAPLREKYISSLQPGQTELDLQTQLQDIRKKAKDFQLSVREGQQAEYGLGRPLALSTGRAEKILEQSQNTAQDFANQEANLLTSLGLAQELRIAQGKGYEAALGYATQDFELQQKVQERLRQQENSVWDRAVQLDTMQRNQLADILTVMKGVNPATLPVEAQNQLAQLASARGIPIDLLLQSMKASYDSEQADILYKSKTSSGLTPAQINTTVNSIAGAFDNEPIVKEYNTIAGQLAFVRTAGSTPTDDISRVYAFAKIMDPNSVVREGEYKTVQDYSQALLNNFGLKAVRVFANTGFLTQEARKFMQDTLQRRLDVSRAQYEQVRNEYQRQINDAQSGAPRTLTNYAVPPPETTYPPGTILNKDGIQYMVGQDGKKIPIGSVMQ